MAYAIPLMPATKEEMLAKINLLTHLVRVAQETTGGEVWRALFSEMRQSLAERVDRQEQL